MNHDFSDSPLHMNKTAIRSALLGLLLLTVTTAQGAITISGFASATNDRFANSPKFVAYNYDLSGIARDEDGRWLAMISPNVFLTAYHYAPVSGTAVKFYATNDPLGPSVTRTVGATGQRFLNSDIWIGVLDQPLTADYTYYPFATERLDEKSFPKSPYYGAEAFLVGRSPTYSFPESQSMAVGRNVLDTWVKSVKPIGGTAQDAAMAALRHWPGEAGFVKYEAYLNHGDSGAGMFVGNALGGLTLVGINWFHGYIDNKAMNGFAYVGNYARQIESFLTLHSLDFQAIPEPAAFALASGLLLLGFGVWRRSKAAVRAASPAGSPTSRA